MRVFFDPQNDPFFSPVQNIGIYQPKTDQTWKGPKKDPQKDPKIGQNRPKWPLLTLFWTPKMSLFSKTPRTPYLSPYENDISESTPKDPPKRPPNGIWPLKRTLLKHPFFENIQKGLYIQSLILRLSQKRGQNDPIWAKKGVKTFRRCVFGKTPFLGCFFTKTKISKKVYKREALISEFCTKCRNLQKHRFWPLFSVLRKYPSEDQVAKIAHFTPKWGCFLTPQNDPFFQKNPNPLFIPIWKWHF
jgi:hypothetical protein